MESANKMRIPLTICGFHLQVADSTYTLRILLTTLDSATAHFNYTLVLLLVCGFHKLFRMPQILLWISQICLFWSNFECYIVLGICLWNPKQQRKSKKTKNVADFATNLILACCGIRLQGTECTVSPRNGAWKGRNYCINVSFWINFNYTVSKLTSSYE